MKSYIALEDGTRKYDNLQLLRYLKKVASPIFLLS